MKKKKYYVFELDVLLLNILSIVFFIIVGLITYMIYGVGIIEAVFSMYLLPTLLGYLILHELLHSLAYVIHGAKFKNIYYGAALEKGVLYCLCKQNITKKNIMFSLMYPLFFIGIVTYVIALLINNSLLLLLSCFNIVGAIGDIVMFVAFLQIKDFEFSEFDNPTGFGLYTKEDLSKRKFLGLKFIEVKDKLEITKTKKVIVSKCSKAIFIALILLSIVNIALGIYNPMDITITKE